MSAQKSLMGRFRESDFFYDFKRSPVTVVSFVIVVMLILLAVFADLVAPTNPFDAGSLNLMKRFTLVPMIRDVICSPRLFLVSGSPYSSA